MCHVPLCHVPCTIVLCAMCHVPCTECALYRSLTLDNGPSVSRSALLIEFLHRGHFPNEGTAKNKWGSHKRILQLGHLQKHLDSSSFPRAILYFLSPFLYQQVLSTCSSFEIKIKSSNVRVRCHLIICSLLLNAHLVEACRHENDDDCDCSFDKVGVCIWQCPVFLTMPSIFSCPILCIGHLT